MFNPISDINSKLNKLNLTALEVTIYTKLIYFNSTNGLLSHKFFKKIDQTLRNATDNDFIYYGVETNLLDEYIAGSDTIAILAEMCPIRNYIGWFNKRQLLHVKLPLPVNLKEEPNVFYISGDGIITTIIINDSFDPSSIDSDLYEIIQSSMLINSYQ
jgi:hypothetical protein